MEEFKNEIDKVLSGEIKYTKSNILIAPEDVGQYLKSVGLEQEDFDSNGWDWDFWMTYSKDSKKYTLSGSGWYNRGLTFSRDEE